MFGLLMRLSALDADAASAVRVIGFFDALVEHCAGIDVILRQTAALAECPVGVRTEDGRFSKRMEPNGVLRSAGPSAGARLNRLSSGDEVWLERDGTVHPLDELLVERFAIAAAVALGSRHRDVADLDAAALLQLAISDTASDAERRRALERLGVGATSTVHVLALAGAAEQLKEIGRDLPGRHRTRIGAIEFLLAADPLPDTGIPVGCRVGVASPHLGSELPEAWREARIALRFTLPSKHPDPPYPSHESALVQYESLGGFAAVAEALNADQIRRIPDVIALDELAEQTWGAEMIRTLEAVAATDSLRRAAKILHVHHNSVAHRVTRAEQVLGYSIADPYARPKLMLALALQRVRASMELF